MKHCCEQMTQHAEGRCPDHEDRADCPDALIHYSPWLNEYSLWIHDGGQSSIQIEFCPWCGARCSDTNARTVSMPRMENDVKAVAGRDSLPFLAIRAVDQKAIISWMKMNGKMPRTTQLGPLFVSR